MLSQLDRMVGSAAGEVALVGHSWGAVLAIEYASQNPSKISNLVLMSTAVNEHQWFDEYHQELKNLGLDNAGPEQILLTPNEIELGVPFLDKSWETFSDETFQSINSSYLEGFDVSLKLQTLNIPIINIFGSKDVGHFPFLLESGRNHILKILKKINFDF